MFTCPIELTRVLAVALLMAATLVTCGNGSTGPPEPQVANLDAGPSDADGDEPFPCDVDDFQTWPEGELHLPGSDCLSCHQVRGETDTVYSVAGTVFAGPACPQGLAGVTVFVFDALGTSIELHSNEAGNFFTAEPLRWPFYFSVEINGVRRNMTYNTPNGSCNSCHLLESTGLVWAAP